MAPKLGSFQFDSMSFAATSGQDETESQGHNPASIPRVRENPLRLAERVEAKRDTPQPWPRMLSGRTVGQGSSRYWKASSDTITDLPRETP